MARPLDPPVVDPAGAQRRWETRQAWLALALVLVGVPFGLLTHQVTRDGPFTALDDRWARWLHDRIADDGGAEALLRAVTFTGGTRFLLLAVTVVVLWLLRRRARRLALFLAVVCAGGALVNILVKGVVGRPRPEWDEPIATAVGKSFPSGHSMSSTICYGAVLVVLLPLVAPRFRRLAIGAVALWVLAIGFTRMALGVHFLSDVLGGYVLGAAWLAGSIALFEVWRLERGRPRSDVVDDGLEPEENPALS